MKTKKRMKAKKGESLLGKTDYAVKETNLLIVLGAIPEEFVEFDPDRGITIDHFITSFMEHFPRSELGEPWMEVFGNSIRYALDLIQYETEPREDVRELPNGETAVAFRDTTRLSREMNISKSKLDTLVHWVIGQNPQVQPFLMHDPVAGYVISSFLLRQLEKSGLRLDQFLKKMVSGQTRFAVN
ncbi:hypothetical protein ACFL2Q_03335 [Thermodesulfobacteriota bacterium]